MLMTDSHPIAHPLCSGELKSESSQSKQISMNAFVNSPRKMSESQSERIMQDITDMVVLDYVPLSIVVG